MVIDKPKTFDNIRCQSNRERGALKMKNKITTIAMRITSGAAMFCAVLLANLQCPWLIHQDKEPEAVRKLRKF